MNATYCLNRVLSMLVIAVHRWCSWVELFSDSPTLAVCIVFSGTLAARPQEKGFHFSSSLNYQNLVLKCAVFFTNRGPFSAPESQPKASSIVYIVWAVTWTTLTFIHQKGGFSCLILRVFLVCGSYGEHC